MSTVNEMNTLVQAEKEGTRKYHLDYAKVIAVVFMVLVHVFWKLGSEFKDVAGYIINYHLGGYMAAPVFMVAMGYAFSLTRKPEPKLFISRGVKLFALAYILNIVRELPLAVYDIATDRSAGVLKQIMSEFFQGDILQFAGLAMILFGVLKKYQWSGSAIFSLSLIMSLIGTLVPVIESDSVLLNATVGLFVFVEYPEETIMCFPIMTWFIFTAFGYWLATMLDTKEKEKSFYKYATIPSLLLSFIGANVEGTYSVFMMNSNSEFYQMLTHDAVISLGYVVFSFGSFYFLCRHLPEKINRFFASLSDSLNLTYMIHWILIYWVMLFMTKIFRMPFTNINGFIVSAFVVCIAFILGVVAKKQIRERLKKNPDSILKLLK